MEKTDFDTYIALWYEGDKDAYDKVWEEAYKYTQLISLRNQGKARLEDLEDMIYVSTSKAMKRIENKKHLLPGNFPAYLSVTFDSVLIDYFRKQSTKKEISVDYLNNLKSSEHLVELDKLQYRRVISALSELSCDQQIVVKARIYADKPYSEIAKDENITLNTALSRYRYGIINIRKILNKKYNLHLHIPERI